MKFSLVNGQRQEAQTSLAGVCPACGRPTIAKCGDVKAWHWAHRGKRDCDPWWENETEWHRAWKDKFPVTWQEVIHYDEDVGEKHIADVKTDQGWVIEFQHSRINPAERRSRNSFYKKIAWVVDGARLKRDIKQFSIAWRDGVPVGRNPGVRKVTSEPCALLREWSEFTAPVFFDFGVPDLLWWLHSKNSDGTINVAAFSRADFIHIHNGSSSVATNFDELLQPIGRQAEANQDKTSSSQPVRPRAQRMIPRNLVRRL